MKKIYKYLLLMILMMFAFVNGVSANDELNACSSNGKCELLCTYKSSEGNAYIYKMNKSYDGKSTTFVTSFTWNVKKIKNAYVFNEFQAYIDDDGEYYSGGGGFSLFNKTSFIDKELIVDYDSFKCPKFVYKNDSGEKEICFDNNGTYCTGVGINKFKSSISNVQVIEEEKMGIEDSKLSAIEAKKKVEEYFKNENDNSEIIELCVFNDLSVAEGYTDQIFIVNSKNRFRYFLNYEQPGVSNFYEFVETNDTDLKISNIISINNSGWGGSCLAISSLYFNSYRIDGEDINEISDKKAINFIRSSEYISDGAPYDSFAIENNEGDKEKLKCEDFLGESLREEINSYLLYIKVAVPIMIIVMGSLDFGKAFISSDEEAMKKAQKKFIMRLIIGLFIFLIPSLINILLNIANQVWGISNGTCGITF